VAFLYTFIRPNSKTMIRKLIVMLCVFCFSSSFAFNGPTGRKKEDPKISLGVSVGAAIPFGWYGRHDTIGAKSDLSHIAGYAKTGFHFNINVGYKLNEYVGAMILVAGNLHGFNSKSYTADYGASYSSDNYINITGTSSYIGSYLIGPFFTIPAGRKLDVNIRAIGGLQTANASSITEVEHTPVSQTSTTIVYTTASGFGYNLGAGIAYRVSDKLSLPFTIDYLGGNPMITSHTSTDAASGKSTASDGYHLNMGVNIINISVGAVLHF
jgi:opacity protein-like surface antigen